MWRQLLITILLIIINSGCTKVGEVVGIDIPDDNIIDENIDKSIWHPIRDQMCEWGFRDTGCEEENTTSSVVDETNSSICPSGQIYDETTAKCVDEVTSCPDGFTLQNGECVSSVDGSGYKDIESKWYDILTKSQQDLIQQDKNNIDPNNKELSILTLLDSVPDGILKMLQNTKVVLPYYVLNDKVDDVLAIARSSDNNITYPRIIDSSNGNFKVIDTNSILFLELEAKGEVGESASVSLKVQEEDATKYDLEELNVSIVDSNHTYNPVSLFFTYNTIIIEESDSRNIYFGISYTIDSDVKVLVRSEVEKILSQLDNNTTLDLTSYGEDNSILSANIVPNDDGVPFYFKLDAKGKAGDTMELFLVAIDNQGNYDYEKFNVLIVGKGEGDYTDVVIGDTNNSDYTPLTGNDFSKLTTTQQALVNNDNNNYDPTSMTRPVITTFNPSNPLKIPKGEFITTTFYVGDKDEGEIYTAVYDDITKVKANMDNLGKFGVTYSNKLFFLKLEAIGEVGDIVPITIYSQNRNDSSLYDQETFNVEIVSTDGDATYIEPLIYLGFNKIFIEEGGYRDGLQFSVTHSKTLSMTADIGDSDIAQFQWITKEPPKFYLKALGTAGDTTTLTITISDGINVDEREIEIEIIPIHTLDDYIDQEGNGDGVTKKCADGYYLDTATNTCILETPTCGTDEVLDTATNTCVPKDNGDTTTCETGYHLENGVCIADTVNLTCDDGYHLEGEQCVSDNGGDPIPPICEDGYHLDNGSCVSDTTEPVCEDGYHLESGSCVPDSGGDPVTPNCDDGYHLEDGSCVVDEKPATCETGYHLENDQCVPNSTDNGTDPIPPICDVGYNLENGVCVIDLVCNDGQHIENGECVDDLPICSNGYHLDSTTNTCIADIPTCETGYHLDETNNTCVADETECPDGQHVEDGICVYDRNLDDIPYSQWTDTEKAQKSLEICYLKLDDAQYTSFQATAVRAEGFSNDRETIILHTNKTPIVNGVTQNVTLTMIYKEIYTADPNSKMLDSTFTVPKFRVDYTVEYSGDTFYIIDEGNGKCYVNIFPSENTLPFGILDLVAPDGVQTNF